MFQKILIPDAKTLSEGKAINIQVADLGFLITKQKGQIIAYKYLCPHQNKHLNGSEETSLDDAGDYAKCSHHGALFSLQDGRCITGPCQGSFLTKATLGIEQGDCYLLLP
ncbi:Rieske 2Fe-2S domain-containing protein [Marinomonas sp.]|nr:Rieske 2Fe-2S domain-containing protein [Marinomonas sp.]MDB4837782.1 Rieske 2Fe-2S domain-containing protein [Marinomonas sp.]